MSFFKKLLGIKSKEEKQAAALALWEQAKVSGDQSAMEMAASDLSINDLGTEYLSAMALLIEKFPPEAYRYWNELGVYFYFEGEYEKAFEHYVKSYHLDEAGGCAESNILEVCQKMASESEDEKDAVKYMMRYFRICTRQPDPEATVENIDLMSVFRSNARPLTDTRAEEAEEALEEVEEILSGIEDTSFVGTIQKELAEVKTQLRN